MAKKKPEKEDVKAEERRRLKNLAFSKGSLSRTPSKLPSTSLPPSKTVLKHQGRDIVKKGQRKNRFLFSFPGFLAPIASGGRIGELADLATGNPILYLEFPQGRMKLFGTIVYPKNRYLTLQFARKNVLCEDSFDSMKDENPEEHQLKFPNEFNEETHEEYDFKGGAGETNGEKLTVNRPPAKEQAKRSQPHTPLTDDTSEDSDVPIGNILQLTPLRQSARTSGKTKSYAECSSGEESISSDTDTSDDMDDKTIAKVVTVQNKISAKIGDSDPQLHDPHTSGGEIINRERQSTEEAKQTSLSLEQSEGKSSNKQGRLVQATLSTLFEKAVDKKLKSTAGSNHSPRSKGSGSKKQYTSPKPKKNVIKKSGGKDIQQGREKAGTGKQEEEHQAQNDAIEEISSDSKDLEESDEEWTA